MAAGTSAAKPILPAGPIVQKTVHSLLREFLCLTLLPRHTYFTPQVIPINFKTRLALYEVICAISQRLLDQRPISGLTGCLIEVNYLRKELDQSPIYGFLIARYTRSTTSALELVG